MNYDDRLLQNPVTQLRERKTPVAIIGMACIFPQASSLQAYWQNIIGKVDCITDVPPSRWNIDDYYNPDPTRPDKTYCKRGGFIPEIDFNPMEFGLPPNILEVTDVAQLLALVVAKQAIKDAGYDRASESIRQRTGVVLGVGGGQKLITPLTSRLQYPIWEKVLKSSGVSDEDTQKMIEKIKLAYIGWEENSFPGMLGNVIAGRIANRLDLGGMNCVVDAACASSLTAVRMGLSELTERRSDMMIVGGVDADNSIFMYMSFSKTPALSKQGQPRPFDAQSDGMMLGEGVGMMVLKRLEDAQADGDRIYAVIKGMGTSSDGKYKSIYAPRSSGQAIALRRAYQDAGFSPATVGLIEAHGTGTKAGDPTEFAAIKEVFSQDNPRKEYIALGSVKSQIGHTKATAGAASMIKTALALYHKVLPPTINITKPNPKLEIEDSPFYLNTEARPWSRQLAETPRRAGVSSFGFGGTNYHAILEEWQSENDGKYRLHGGLWSVMLWAETSTQLLDRCLAVQVQLSGEDGQKYYSEIAKNSVIPSDGSRVGFVAHNLGEARELLQLAIENLKSKATAASWQHPRGIYYRSSSIADRGKVVALFSGQGSQYLEMGREVAINYPPMREACALMDSKLIQDGLPPISQVLFPPPTFSSSQKKAQEAALAQTENAQAAIGLLSFGLYKILQQAGFKPDIVAGHSFGELTALWAAGVVSESDYFFLVRARGQAMASLKTFDAGSMLAVKGDGIDKVILDASHIKVANYNSPNQVVLAAEKREIAKVQQQLAAAGYSVVPLAVSAAFHTPLVADAQKHFAQALSACTLGYPKIPVYSNTTASDYPNNPQKIRETLVLHMVETVRFQEEIENIYGAGGYIFVEFGPRNILTNLVKDILGDKPHLAVALNASRQQSSDLQLQQAVMQLRVAGLPLGNMDPYFLEPQASTSLPKKGLTVRLNGSNYVSEKTKAAFEKALRSGHKVSLPLNTEAVGGYKKPEVLPEPEISQMSKSFQSSSTANNSSGHKANVNSVAPELEMSDMSKLSQSPQSANNSSGHKIEEVAPEPEILDMSNLSQSPQSAAYPGGIEGMRSPAIDAWERIMMRFQEHQGEVLRVHEQYLKEQAQYAQGFFQLMQQQYSQLTVTRQEPGNEANGAIAGRKIPGSAVPDRVVAPTVSEVEPVVAKTTVAPKMDWEPSVSSAPPVVEKAMAPAPSVSSAPPVVEKPTATPKMDLEPLKKAMLEVVSEKTGYPAEMLELEMDMEADLGIDSIKRVEIMGSMQELFPDMPPVNPEELAELRTLGEVVEYMGQQISSPAATPAAPSISSQSGSALETQQLVDLEPLKKAMLEVVSEKTGYPADMLELEMDMEADLGIDSIKRVEIMGSMQELFPEMPPINPEELAELRTLGEVVQYMGPLVAEKKSLMPVH